MTEPDSQIVHVSDTALMVAACRAMETERADGLIHDPFAARLAGERGMAIAKALPALPVMCFGIGIRSRFIDELLLHALKDAPIQTVLSLGAGLDTRPWRLDISDRTRWIEVDLPAMLDYKERMMAGIQPRCRVERIVADLNDPTMRQELFRSVGSTPALMITEGLLMYLPAPTVEVLAAEAPRSSGIHYWLTNLETVAFSQAVAMDRYKSVQNVRAAGSLDGSAIFERAAREGWRSVQTRSYLTDVWAAVPERVKELTALQNPGKPPSDEPPPQLLPPDDITGVHLFAHGSAAA